MICELCLNHGKVRTDLRNDRCLCDLHYKITKTLEGNHSQYFRVRNRVIASQNQKSISRIERNRIRRETTKMIKKGIIQKKPCEVCQTTEKVEVHHPDYTDEKNVVFLCEKHHREHHRNNK